jgi:demethylmenaquinone methyltransferase/2-methoxy-6-polyprenyl-1,4-benzoquinol methylase
MFDQIAPTYELVNRVASAGRDAGWRREMVRLTEVRPDDVLLDIACGTGDVARTYAGAKTRPARILGLDFSLPMLRGAAARPIAAGSFCQGDALRLPVADGSATITTCAFGIRNFQDLQTGFREMHRVLRPGGRAVILEFTVPRTPLFRRAYLFYIRHVLPRVASVISRDRTGAYRYLPSSVLSFQDRDAIVAGLEAAGFTPVTAHPLSLGIVAVYVARKPPSPANSAW